MTEDDEKAVSVWNAAEYVCEWLGPEHRSLSTVPRNAMGRGSGDGIVSYDFQQEEIRKRYKYQEYWSSRMVELGILRVGGR